MNQNLTELVLIVDRSGSMSDGGLDKEATVAINNFIQKQKEADGDANLTLVEFDNEYNVIHNGVPLDRVNVDYTLQPRGSTALVDAVGTTLNSVGKRLSDTPEHDRPGLVLVMIVTDGGENSSREFSRSQVKDMIEHQQDKYSWKFTYLGANQDAFAESAKYGFHQSGTANYSNYSAAMNATSDKFHRMRNKSVRGMVVSNDDNEYTETELTSMA